MAGSGTGWWTRVVFVLVNECSLVARVDALVRVDPPGRVSRSRASRGGLSRWGSSSTVSAGRLHPSRGFHVRSIDHMVSCGVSRTRKGCQESLSWSGLPA